MAICTFVSSVLAVWCTFRAHLGRIRFCIIKVSSAGRCGRLRTSPPTLFTSQCWDVIELLETGGGCAVAVPVIYWVPTPFLIYCFFQSLSNLSPRTSLAVYHEGSPALIPAVIDRVRHSFWILNSSRTHSCGCIVPYVHVPCKVWAIRNRK